MYTPYLQGGHDPRSCIHFHSWGSVSEKLPSLEGEWEGKIDDMPATLLPCPQPIHVYSDQRNTPVQITNRGQLSERPTIVHIDPPVYDKGLRGLVGRDIPVQMNGRVHAFRGRWWEEESERPARAYCCFSTQVSSDLLLLYRGGQWWIEGIYDE